MTPSHTKRGWLSRWLSTGRVRSIKRAVAACPEPLDHAPTFPAFRPAIVRRREEHGPLIKPYSVSDAAGEMEAIPCGPSYVGPLIKTTSAAGFDLEKMGAALNALPATVGEIQRENQGLPSAPPVAGWRRTAAILPTAAYHGEVTLDANDQPATAFPEKFLTPAQAVDRALRQMDAADWTDPVLRTRMTSIRGDLLVLQRDLEDGK